MIELKLHLVELERDNYHILVKGDFLDGKSYYWIIDTGASKSVLDSKLTDYYEPLDSEFQEDYQGAGINQGMIETEVANLKFLKIGEIEIIDLKVALIDLEHINEIYERYSDFVVAGLIGGDILKKYNCLIDYKNELIFLHP